MFDQPRKPQRSLTTDVFAPERITKRELAYCEGHNIEFEIGSIRLGPGEYPFGGCPRCFEESMQRQEVERQRQAEQERRGRAIEAARRAAQIRRRFEHASFDNYETAGDERMKKTLDVLVSYAARFDEARESGACLILAGLPGTGKTHLAAALANALVEMGYGPKYFTAAKLFRHIRDTYSKSSRQTTQEVIDQLAALDLLIIDEIGVQRGTDDELNLLFEVVDERYNACAPTILISNLPPDDLKALIGDRVIDRLRDNGGRFLGFNWESFRRRKPSQPRTQP